MAYEKKPGDGTLWINDKKTQDKHADRKGDALIHCPQCSHNFEVWINGWLKKKSDGESFLSLSIKSKEDPGRGPRSSEQRRSNPIAQRPPPRSAPPPPPADPDDDASPTDIPF